MSFKEFIDKYLGMIIGILIAIIIIIVGAVYVCECTVLIIALGWFGKYFQENKDVVKSKIKNWIDRV